jgi:hypothetical protein
VKGPSTSNGRQRRLANGSARWSWARDDLVRLLERATDAELDYIDESRRLPEWALWRTGRQMAWHCAITESCHYQDRVGVRRPQPFAELTRPLPAPPTAAPLELLAVSQAHVERWIERLPYAIVVATHDEVWTARKVLRRSLVTSAPENDVTALLLKKARQALA